MKPFLVATIAVLLMVASPLGASAVTISGTTTSGDVVNATVTATLGTNTITFTITNNLINQTSVGQNVSDVDFRLSNPSLTPSLLSVSGTLINVGAGGTITPAGSCAGTCGWALQASSFFTGGFEVSALLKTADEPGTFGVPSRTIIGAPGGPTYANANGSIDANAPHNPFITGTTTIVVSVPNLGAATLTDLTLSFGTGGSFVQTVPEPATLLLLGSGLAGIGVWMRRRRRQ